MLDIKDFEHTENLLLKINELVAKMDPAVRTSAFDLLINRYIEKQSRPSLKSSSSSAGNSDDDSNDSSLDTADLGTFISSFDTKKPVDALLVLVAWLYSKNGAQAFSIADLKSLADDCGLTIPSRPDMTFKGSKSNGKSNFQQIGRNWKITVSGELFIRENYKVTKGNPNRSGTNE